MELTLNTYIFASFKFANQMYCTQINHGGMNNRFVSAKYIAHCLVYHKFTHITIIIFNIFLRILLFFLASIYMFFAIFQHEFFFTILTYLFLMHGLLRYGTGILSINCFCYLHYRMFKILLHTCIYD